MKAYQAKSGKLPGTDYHEVYKKAFGLYKGLRRKTKRRPYIRSAYFKNDKIFLGLYWSHLHEKKNFRDKVRRMKYFPCGIELIQHSRINPVSKEDPNNPSEILHRFAGITQDKEVFFVQIKEN